MKVSKQIKYSSFENSAQLLSVFDYFLAFDDCEMCVDGSMKDGKRVDFIFYLESGRPSIQTMNCGKFPFTHKSTIKIALIDLVEAFILDTVNVKLEVRGNDTRIVCA